MYVLWFWYENRYQSSGFLRRPKNLTKSPTCCQIFVAFLQNLNWNEIKDNKNYSIRLTFICPSAELTWVSTQGWFLSFSTSIYLFSLKRLLYSCILEIVLNFDLKTSLSNLVSKQEKVKDYPWVETHVNSALGVTLILLFSLSFISFQFRFSKKATKIWQHVGDFVIFFGTWAH